ncbi:MAG TPA: molybdenum cofactor guanylyltransferase, partial [Phycisphaerales bacterium]|nr:molybdenum cofactor guanylyltransferase [Phycisphaerales bacterium]
RHGIVSTDRTLSARLRPPGGARSDVNLDTIQPVVLVGGRSKRFGRDKLIEPVRGQPLAAYPVDALRAVFGPRVALVGACDPAVAALGDAIIPDPYPGTGPAGGILAALEHSKQPVFVLSGDLPAISADHVRAVLQAGSDHPDSPVCMAMTDRPQPCIALYRPGAVGAIRGAVQSGRGLLSAVGSECTRVPIDAGAAVNVNRPGDLPDVLGAGG